MGPDHTRDGAESDEPIHLSGSSSGPPELDAALRRWFHAGLPLTPRRYSGRLRGRLAIMRATGPAPDVVDWSESAWQMAVPLLGHLWTRRMTALLAAGLADEGYRVERMTTDHRRRLVTLRARRVVDG
jgi:hypothetical protein